MKKNEKMDTKEKIREEAIKLFKEHGYNRVTVMQICEAAGITKRTFYYHYKSKEQLISGVTNSMGIKAEQLVSTMISQKSNLGVLWEIMSTYSKNSVNMGPDLIMQVYISEFNSGKTENFPQDAYLFSTTVQIIKKAQNSGESSNMADALDTAFALYHSFRGATITWAASNGSFDLNVCFLKLFNTILGANYTPDGGVK